MKKEQERQEEEAEEQEQEEEQQPAGGQHMPPTLRNISKEQVMLTGGALLTSGLADVALHLDKTGVFMGLLASFVVARHSNDILSTFIPGRDREHVVEMTERVLEMAARDGEAYDDEEYRDQSVPAKLKRLFSFKPLAPIAPKRTMPEPKQAGKREPEPRTRARTNAKAASMARRARTRRSRAVEATMAGDGGQRGRGCRLCMGR
jgi:hypothetical protein